MPSGTYITKETFHNHGGDVESDEPCRHRRTQQYPTQDGNQVSVDFDNPVTTMSMTPPRSLEDILNEYRDRQTQPARLQAELAETTDPDMQKFLQDQITVQTNILADITTAALAAGATQADLDQITNEAQEAGENDPIDNQEGESTFFDGSWFDLGVFGSTFAGEVGAIGDGFAGIYHDLIGDDALAQQLYATAYENGPLGLTANDDGFYYYGTRGALAVAVGATAAAVAAGTMPQMSIGVARNGHFAWTRGTTWWHATSRGSGVFRAVEWTSSAQRLGCGAWLRTFTVPVFNSQQAIFAGTTTNCATGAGWAWFNAGGAAALPIVIDTGLIAGWLTYWGLTNE